MNESKVEEMLIRAMEGANVDHLIREGLNSDEQTLFYDLLHSLKTEDTTAMDDLWSVDYTRRPPSMREFIEDEYWLGQVLTKSADSEGLWPTWKDTLIKDFDLDSRVHNVVITGSLGIGKSYAMCVIFLYRIALATLLRNPQQFYGLGRGSKIFFVMLSLSKGVVEETVFGDIQNFMAHSQYFIEECKFDPDSKHSNFRISLGKGIFLSAGSKSWHIIGRNAMGVCLDEGNWRLEANPDQRAYQLYGEIMTRIQNRFQRISGFLPAISILASSARDESSFTEKVITEIRKADDTNTQNVYRYAVYDIKKHLLNLGNSKWFRVAYGLKSMDPHCLTGWYDGDRKPVTDPTFVHEEPTAGAQIEYVPERYLQQFRRNCKHSLQSISGISTGGSFRLFSSLMDVEKCLEISHKEGLVNPCAVDYIPLSEENDKQIWDFLDHPKFLTRRSSLVIPLRHPEAKRFAHLDLATQSMAGLSVCHLVGQQLVEGIVKGGHVFSEYRLIVEYDFILTIVAGDVKPISIEKIQNFFFWLRDICHYSFGLITADQWQSEAPLQMMEKRDFAVDKLSLDKKKDQYYAWRTGFEEHRIRMFKQRQLILEMEDLVDGPDKVDHPHNGSKDTTDGAGGAYWNAINSEGGIPLSQEVPHMESGSEVEESSFEPVAIPMPLSTKKVHSFEIG